MLRKALIIFSRIGLLLSLAVSLSCGSRQKPAYLEPKVHRGSEFFGKRVVLDDTADIGGITDIKFWPLRGTEERTIVVAGTKGALILEPVTYHIKKRIQYSNDKPPFNEHKIVDANGDGNIEFFRISHPGGQATLYDTDGVLMWTYGDRKLDKATIGDLDADGKLEFVLTGHASKTLYVVDHDGHVKWSKDLAKAPTEVILLDTTGDGHEEIVYIDGLGVTILDAEGNLVLRRELPEHSYVNALCAVTCFPAPLEDQPPCMCVGYHVKHPVSRQVFRVLELDAKTVVKELRPEELWRYLPTDPVRLASDSEYFRFRIEWLPYQEVFVGFSATRLSLRVYDSEDKLAYHETLASPEGELAKGYGASAAVPGSHAGEEALLVGFGPGLWEYRRKR